MVLALTGHILPIWNAACAADEDDGWEPDFDEFEATDLPLGDATVPHPQAPQQILLPPQHQQLAASSAHPASGLPQQQQDAPEAAASPDAFGLPDVELVFEDPAGDNGAAGWAAAGGGCTIDAAAAGSGAGWAAAAGGGAAGWAAAPGAQGAVALKSSILTPSDLQNAAAGAMAAAAKSPAAWPAPQHRSAVPGSAAAGGIRSAAASGRGLLTTADTPLQQQILRHAQGPADSTAAARQLLAPLAAPQPPQPPYSAQHVQRRPALWQASPAAAGWDASSDAEECIPIIEDDDDEPFASPGTCHQIASSFLRKDILKESPCTGHTMCLTCL